MRSEPEGTARPKHSRSTICVGCQKFPNMTRRSYLFLAVAALLALPAIGMLISDEVNWSPFDFVVGFVLMGGTALAIDFLWSKLKTRRSRLIAVGAVLFVLVFIWAELAVGLVGSPWAGN